MNADAQDAKYLTDFEGGKRLNCPDDIEVLLINIRWR